MRLLLVNPNTSEAATAAFLGLAREAAAENTEIRAATGRFGAALMRSPAELAIGAHALLDAVAEHGEDCDAVVVAAFGDYGAAAAADLFRMPVITLAEAAFAMLRLAGCRYSILTVAPELVGAVERAAAAHRAAETLIGAAAVELAPGHPDYAAAAVEALRRTVARDRPETVLIVGPPLAALMPELRQATDATLVEGVACAVRLAESLGRLGLGRRSGPAPATPTTPQHVGVPPRLAAALAARR